jgi:hypothetical protein
MLNKLLSVAVLSGLVAISTAIPQARAGGNAVATSHATANGCHCGMCGSMNMSGMDISMPAPAAAADLAPNAAPAKAPSQSNSLEAEPYGGQKTCPVSGKSLGAMGKPIAVKVNGATVYLCCNGCVARFNANPDFYLAKVQKEVNKK